MKIRLLTSLLLVSVSLSNLQGQTITKKDLEGYWRSKSNDAQRNYFIRFYHFYDDNSYKLSIDSLNSSFLQGTYSIKKMNGESILMLYITFLSKTDSSAWLIRRYTQNSFILKDATFTKSGGLRWKWNEIVKALTYDMDRIDVKMVSTKAI